MLFSDQLTGSLVVPFTCHVEGLSVCGSLPLGEVDQAGKAIAIIRAGEDVSLSAWLETTL